MVIGRDPGSREPSQSPLSPPVGFDPARWPVCVTARWHYAGAKLIKPNTVLYWNWEDDG